VGVLAVLAFIPFLFWIALLADRRRSWPSDQLLTGSGGPPGGPAELARNDGECAVAAIVPARDEAALLPETLPALLAQDHRGFRVVLVDDRSSDGTAALAREIAIREGRAERLTVVEAGAAPAGWTGKLHALEEGLAALRRGSGGLPGWILLTDADILHPPDSARSLLDRARRGGHDLVSVMARLHAGSFWERLLIPPFVFFFQLLYPFRRASDPASGVAAAAGGCILVRALVLESAGCFGSIAGEIIDDLALARAVRRAGGCRWLGLDPRIASLRSYTRLGDLWRMVSRTAFVQLGRRFDLLAVTSAALLCFLILPPLLVGPALLAGRPFAAAAALGAWLIPAAMLLPSTRYHRTPSWYALALPAASLLYLLMTLSSAWDHLRGRGPLWRGRRFQPGTRTSDLLRDDGRTG
jgi:hopene-associated glycosyltransferase HpnB